MPYLRVETNVEAPDGVVPHLSAGLARLLGKDERWVMVRLVDGQTMTYGGTDAPCAYVQLESLGLEEEACGPLAFGITAMLQEHLGVSAERIYIHMDAPPRTRYGWSGRTFE